MSAQLQQMVAALTATFLDWRRQSVLDVREVRLNQGPDRPPEKDDKVVGG